MTENKGFDGDGFYRALERIVESRSKNWKTVAADTGVSASTLTRMAKGQRPDAASLAALSAWSGLNPADFVDMPYKAKAVGGEVISQFSTLLRQDPNLDEKSAEALETIVRTAYEQLKRQSG